MGYGLWAMGLGFEQSLRRRAEREMPAVRCLLEDSMKKLLKLLLLAGIGAAILRFINIETTAESVDS